MTTNLGDVLEMIKDKESKENISMFENVFLAHKFTNESLLTDYIKYIDENTYEWFKNGSANVKNESTARHMKTPINNIIKGTKYIELAQLIDNDVRNELPKKLLQVQKQLVEEGRFKRSTRKKEKVYEDSISEEGTTDDYVEETDYISHNEDNELQKENNTLKLHIKELEDDKKELKNLLKALLTAYKKDFNGQHGLADFTELVLDKI